MKNPKPRTRKTAARRVMEAQVKGRIERMFREAFWKAWQRSRRASVRRKMDKVP